MQSIGVLITVFNRKSKTLECLKRLYSQLPLDNYQVDVYLTNDGCTDGTPEAIKAEFPEIKIIEGDGNLFWNRGMYTAWLAAAKNDYDFYLWLNDDLKLKDGSLIHILSCSKEANNESIISGLVSSLDGNTTTYGGRRNGIKVQRDGTMQRLDIMHGNFVLIPKKVFNIVGFNDPYYNHAYGDHDYSLMAKEKGFKIYTTRDYIGECDVDNKVPKCFLPNIHFQERWRILHTPLAYAKPNEIFYFEKKHHNICLAVFRFLMVYLRCCFPKLWMK